MDSDHYTCGTCRHGNLQDNCGQCEKEVAAELMREQEPPLRFGSKEWGEQWMANIREAWKDYESLDEALSAMEKEEWPKPGELGRPR